MSPNRATLVLVASLALVGLGAGRAAADDLKGVEFTIAAGEHRATGEGAGPCATSAATGRTLRFEIRFAKTAAYATKDPANQLDWNKVMGLSTPMIHGDSVRLGWRYAPKTKRIELALYGYVKSKRVSRPVASVKLGAWAKVQIRFGPEGLAVTVGRERVAIDEAPGFTTPSFVLRTAYFGGDETAPHAIGIEVRKVKVVDDAADR